MEGVGGEARAPVAPEKLPLIPVLVFKALGHLKLHPSSQLGTRGGGRGAASGRLRAKNLLEEVISLPWPSKGLGFVPPSCP